MALDILVTTNRIARDPVGRSFVDFLNNHAHQLSLDDAILYYDFPTYSDYETVTHKPDALLVSRCHGILAFRFFESKELASEGGRARVPEIDDSLSQFCSILIGRLLKSRLLRSNRATLSFQVRPVMFFSALATGISVPRIEGEAVTSFDGLGQLLAEIQTEPAKPEMIAEIRAVVEGARRASKHPPVVDSSPRIGIIRYENGPAQYRAFHHPCSHFHIGFQAENRWPANRVITPVAFTLLLMKHYYGAFWERTGTDNQDAFGNKYESFLAREKIECALVDQALFSESESRVFYFS